MTKKIDWYFCVWILAFRQKVLALEGNHSFVTFLAPWPLFCKTFNWGWIFFCSFNIEKRKYDKYSSWSLSLNKKQRTREQRLLKMPSRQSHFKSSTKLKMIDEATVFDEATRHVSENTEWRKNPSFWRFCSNWCDWHFFYLGNLFSFILSSRKQQSFSSSRHRFKFSKQKLFRLCFVFGGKIKTNKLSWTVFFGSNRVASNRLCRPKPKSIPAVSSPEKILGPDFIQTIKKFHFSGSSCSIWRDDIVRKFSNKKKVHHILAPPTSPTWKSLTTLERSRTTTARTRLSLFRPPAVCMAAGSLPEILRKEKKNEFKKVFFWNWISFDGQSQEMGTPGGWRNGPKK